MVLPSKKRIKGWKKFRKFQSATGLLLELLPQTLDMSLGKQIVAAVRHLEKNGVIHGDLKLNNIMVDPGMTPVRIALFDSGCAVFRGDGAADMDKSMNVHVHVGTNFRLGNMCHLAPEVLEGCKRKSKLKGDRSLEKVKIPLRGQGAFAVGVVLYELAMGLEHPVNDYPMMNSEEAFDEIDFVSLEEKAGQPYTNVVRGLLTYDAQKRISLDSALQKLEPAHIPEAKRQNRRQRAEIEAEKAIFVKEKAELEQQRRALEQQKQAIIQAKAKAAETNERDVEKLKKKLQQQSEEFAALIGIQKTRSKRESQQIKNAHAKAVAKLSKENIDLVRENKRLQRENEGFRAASIKNLQEVLGLKEKVRQQSEEIEVLVDTQAQSEIELGQMKKVHSAQYEKLTKECTKNDILTHEVKQLQQVLDENYHLKKLVSMMQLFNLNKISNFDQLIELAVLGAGGNGMVASCIPDFRIAHVHPPQQVAVKIQYNFGARSSLIIQNGEKDFMPLAGLPFHKNIIVVLANLGLVQFTKHVVKMLPVDIRDLCQKHDHRNNTVIFLKTSCMVMEHHPRTLKSLIKLNDKSLHEQAGFLKIAKGILSGLAHLHKYHVEHNDLKPDNILISKHGQPVICDFGEAIVLDHDYSVTFFHGDAPAGNQSHRAPEVINALKPLSLSRYVRGMRHASVTVSYLKATAWAAGILLFEAGCGGLHPIDDLYPAIPTLDVASCTFQKKRHQELPKSWPNIVATAIEGLLLYEPTDRWSLDDALEALQGRF